MCAQPSVRPRASQDAELQFTEPDPAALGSRLRGKDRKRGPARSISAGFAVTWLVAIAAALLAVSPTAVAAEDYPAKPVRIIVPFPPAALNDMVGRAIAASLSERLGKQFIVENRSGAGGTLGSEYVAHAPKDGYTLLIVSLAGAVNRWLYPLSFDPVTSFAPIASIVTTPAVVAVNPDLPAKSLKEFVALAKEKPGGVQYASSGVGTFLHLAGELFKTSAGVDLLHMPFKGGGPGHDRRHRRPLPGGVRLGRLDRAACPIRQAPRARRRRPPRAVRRSPTFQPPRRPACPATRPPTGSASWRRPARPSAIVAKLHTEISAALDAPEIAEAVRVRWRGALADELRRSSAHTWWPKPKNGSRVVKAGKIKAQ